MLFLRIIQNTLLGLSLIILSFLPLWVAFGDDNFAVQNILFQTSFFAVFLVMLIRPLSDIFPNQKWLRSLILLRKGVGVFSAAIIVGFMIGKIIMPESVYLKSILTVDYWSLNNYKLFAHLGDLTGLVLLFTSNNLFRILLKKNWKRLQKLAYVYFYAGGIYEAYPLNNHLAMIMMLLVTFFVLVAFMLNWRRRILKFNN